MYMYLQYHDSCAAKLFLLQMHIGIQVAEIMHTTTENPYRRKYQKNELLVFIHINWLLKIYNRMQYI